MARRKREELNSLLHRRPAVKGFITGKNYFYGRILGRHGNFEPCQPTNLVNVTLTERECKEAAKADCEIRRFDFLRKQRWYYATFLGLVMGSSINSQLSDGHFEAVSVIIPVFCILYYFELARHYTVNHEKLRALEKQEPRLAEWLRVSRGNLGTRRS
jgi:hypothetical protein